MTAFDKVIGYEKEKEENNALLKTDFRARVGLRRYERSTHGLSELCLDILFGFTMRHNCKPICAN